MRRIIMQKVQTDKGSGVPSGIEISEGDSTAIIRNNSMQSEPPPKLAHKESNISIQSVVSFESKESKNSAEEPSDPTKTSKLQIIKDKVSMMVKSSPKITLDSIKMESIDDFVAYITTIEKPEKVTHFSKNNSRLGDEMVSSLPLPRMAALTYLSLQNANLTQKGFVNILMAELPELRFLYLAHNQIGDCQLKEVGGNKLNLLSLTNNGVTAKGVKNMKKIFQNLQSLTLKLNKLGAEGFKELMSGEMLKLKHLHLESCGLDAESMDWLAAQGIQKQFPKLVSVYLNNNPIQQKGLQKLLSSPLTMSLEVIHLQGSISSQPLSAFKQHFKSLTKLTLLNLSNNNLTDQLLKDLTSISLPSLNMLNLDNNNLTIESLNRLSRSEFPWLLHLMINSNPEIMSKIHNHKSLPYSFYSAAKKNHNKILFNL